MASLYIHVLAIYSDGRMLLSPDGTTERSEMVSLSDIDRITKADGPAMIGRFRLRLREGREQQSPYRLWLDNVNVVKPNGAAAPKQVKSAESVIQHGDKIVTLPADLFPPGSVVDKGKIETYHENGRITGEERDRLLNLISQ